MAEVIILSPVAKVIIERLGSTAVNKIGSLWGVKDDLEELKDTLLTIQAVLLDAEKQQSRSDQVKLWLQRLEDVVNDADDLVDDIATEGLRQQLMSPTWLKKVQIFFSSSNQIMFDYRMGIEIRSVRKKMARVAADRRDFQLVESRDEIVRHVRNGRETHSFVVEENVVGRVVDKREVLELLLSPENKAGQERVSVIPIVGMGGLGKTTLAQLVFNDGEVKKRFEPRIWVCVSEDFDEKTLVGRIVESITNTFTKDDSMEKLQKTLRERIDGNRYLLVLDDVWSEDGQKWKNVKDLLTNCGESGSKIVVTTRSERVAKLSSKMRPHRLRILGKVDSWSLFEKIAFEREQEPTEVRYVEIGKEIVKKCGGVPLAIRMIASMLSYRDPKTEWLPFLNKEFSSIPQQEDDILPTLKLSYNYLPSPLKRCFVFCRLFPKDYRFDVETLVILWIAQGFISVPSDGSRSLEDVGHDYFLELVWRSFFQEVEIDKAMNKVIACKMHDLVHDLSIHIAGENYVSLDLVSPSNSFEKVRHVSLGLSRVVPSSLLQAKRLRSFIQPHTSYYFTENKLPFKEVAFNFRLLRMLDLHNSQIDEVPNSIGKLKHLRYLDLSENSRITRLPTSISKLVNLQTLKLTGCHSLRELGKCIVKLVNLRHLTWSNNELSLPRGVSQLTNLRTLSNFRLSEDPAHSKLDELMGLNNLRGCLAITRLRSEMRVKGTILKEKEHLQSILLEWANLDSSSTSNDQEQGKILEELQPHQNLRMLTVKGYDGVIFSHWLSSLTNLVELRLWRCLKLKQLERLEPLRFLKFMLLDSCNELKCIAIDVNSDCYFPSRKALPHTIPVLPSLQLLHLTNLPNFRGWRNSSIPQNEHQGIKAPYYFPRLSGLKVRNCSKLNSMPLYPNVKVIELHDTSEKPFEQTISTNIADSSSSSSSSSNLYPLSEVELLRLFCSSEVDVQHFPSWMRNLTSLETLMISGLTTAQLESQRISVTNRELGWKVEAGDEHKVLDKEKWTSWEIVSGIRKLILARVPIFTYLSLASQHVTSLDTLQIQEKEDLEFNSDQSSAIEWRALTSLQTVIFYRLPNSAALPNWLKRVTTLKSLKISHCSNLSGIPNWIGEFSLLQRLELLDCEKLESLPASLSSLDSLQALTIKDCPLILFEKSGGADHNQEIKWESFTRLRTLTFVGLPTLVTLPDGLQHVATLQHLEVRSCKNLTALPEWLGKMSSLQELVIYYSPKIESLPGSMRSLLSLRKLVIYGCPLLYKRCRMQTGEDWPIIQHIQYIHVLDRRF